MNVDRYEITDEGLLFVDRNNTSTFITWKDVVNMQFASGSFGGTLDFIGGKNFGFYQISDEKNNTIKIPPTVTNRDGLIREIIQRGNLKKNSPNMQTSLFGSFISPQRYKGDFNCWTKNETGILESDLDVSPRKFSSFTDYLIAGTIVIVIMGGMLLVFHYMQVSKGDNVGSVPVQMGYSKTNIIKSGTAPVAVTANNTSNYVDSNTGISMDYLTGWRQWPPENGSVDFDFVSEGKWIASIHVGRDSVNTVEKLMKTYKLSSSGATFDEKDFTYKLQNGTVLVGKQAKFETSQTGQPGGIINKSWLVTIPYKGYLYTWKYESEKDNFDKFKNDAVTMLNTWKIDN